MNDLTYLEAARGLAKRMLKEGGKTDAERLAYGFELATSRPPKARESEILLTSFHYYLDMFQGDPAAAAKLVSDTASRRDQDLNPSQLAAYATMGSMILNLDETVTKE